MKQIVDSVILGGGKTYFEVTIRMDQNTGKLKSIYEWIEHGGKDVENPATIYDEKFPS